VQIRSNQLNPTAAPFYDAFQAKERRPNELAPQSNGGGFAPDIHLHFLQESAATGRSL
jgi:hypothetical protein